MFNESKRKKPYTTKVQIQLHLLKGIFEKYDILNATHLAGIAWPNDNMLHLGLFHNVDHHVSRDRVVLHLPHGLAAREGVAKMAPSLPGAVCDEVAP